jgi:hypothetical protein
VVVHFTRSFEEFLTERDLYLDTVSFALNGNIRQRSTRVPEPQEVVARLIDDFFAERTADLPAIEGAVEALQILAEEATVVMLTNLPHHARDKRIANLRSHGLSFPLVTNSGPKGPAIRHLADNHGPPIVFIDDSPNFIASSREHAPEVHLLHFLHDKRYARLHQPFDFVSLTTGSWADALPHIQALIR